MDWNSILTLINGVDTLLGAVILVLASRYLLRAGRSWWQRRSEPTYCYEDPWPSEGSGWRSHPSTETCPKCQPASQPQSAPTSSKATETPEATQHGS